ncbi:MAG: prolyl oligopeptidase family serine peptidase, partial [Acidobacteriaceae bacterium]|nr:prolyl oligopeptidase family serine peptidase [Acidobacteriaceae bacterium]
LFTALQESKIPSKLIQFPDEGHWILKPQNSQFWYSTVLDWLNEWTKKTSTDPKPAASN